MQGGRRVGDGWLRGKDELCHRCLSTAAVCLTVGLRIRSIDGSRGECAALTAALSEMVHEWIRREKKTGFLFTNRAGAMWKSRERSTRKHPSTPILRIPLPESIRLPGSGLPQPDGACGE